MSLCSTRTLRKVELPELKTSRGKTVPGKGGTAVVFSTHRKKHTMGGQSTGVASNGEDKKNTDPPHHNREGHFGSTNRNAAPGDRGWGGKQDV